ncbi:MAG: hypothetical protein BGO05_25790 [Rhizobiales bacterium 63-7]|uniref:LptA/OstA family protein n=1 Tax=Rhizobium sp. YJ-22 TaxID=3037556 RepID=UPI00092BEF04|nr:LptA/OstA family protein [Rhizobium sp. YJ-22]MBN9033174.1 LptA/OstA family protein [Hyphomicrobiales bacterium]MDG3575394.1 LptA/OstA family protein [Rhizobium sp. YJ-22]OJU70596.1 MAG: hypothetical protein BGO05_25790 [Rhizobiales bacterium 63-7]
MSAPRPFFRLSAAALLAAGTLSGPVAFAQSTTTGSMNNLKLSNDQPIQIESDKLEIKEQESVAYFTGNVKVVQGATTMQAGNMTVYYKKKGDDKSSVASGNADIDRILVDKKVFLSSGEQQATADAGTFDMASQTFTLTGKRVVLSEGANVFTGCKLTVLMATGKATLESCGQRVQIQLDPKSQKKN